MTWDIGTDIFTLLCIKQVTNENTPLQHRELCSVLREALNGKEIKKGVYLYTWLILCCAAEPDTAE